MSRVGKSPIVLQGAEATLSDEKITVKGPLGTISQAANRLVKVVNDNGTLKFEPTDESRLGSCEMRTGPVTMQTQETPANTAGHQSDAQFVS